MTTSACSASSERKTSLPIPTWITIGRGILHVEDAPESVQMWHRRLSPMAQIDPWVFYAKNIRTDEADYQRFCESAAAIQSAEGQNTIVIRIRRGGDDARIELICDKTADCLPTKYRIGTLREGLWIPWAEESCEWRKTGEVWFPAHQVTQSATLAKTTSRSSSLT